MSAGNTSDAAEAYLTPEAQARVEIDTYLLFLKMADEQTKPPFSGRRFVPEGLDWASLLALDGEELEAHYIHLLRELGRQPGMLGVVFRSAQNRIQDPAKLRRLIVDLIDRERWMTRGCCSGTRRISSRGRVSTSRRGR